MFEDWSHFCASAPRRSQTCPQPASAGRLSGSQRHNNFLFSYGASRRGKGGATRWHRRQQHGGGDVHAATDDRHDDRAHRMQLDRLHKRERKHLQRDVGCLSLHVPGLEELRFLGLWITQFIGFGRGECRFQTLPRAKTGLFWAILPFTLGDGKRGCLCEKP